MGLRSAIQIDARLMMMMIIRSDHPTNDGMVMMMVNLVRSTLCAPRPLSLSHNIGRMIVAYSLFLDDFFLVQQVSNPSSRGLWLNLRAYDVDIRLGIWLGCPCIACLTPHG